MKTYQAIFKENEKNVFAISLVDDPAMQSMFIALKKEEKLKYHELKFSEVDKKERTLLGVVLVPDRPIYRNQGGEEFNITFSKDVIRDSAHHFFTEGFNLNSSIEHEEKVEGISFVESWIVKDSKNDTANAYGLPKEDIVDGSWVIKMKCDNENIYGKALSGEIKGFSIDGFFGLEEVNLKANIKMEETILKKIEKTLLKFLKKEGIKLGSVRSREGDITFNYDGDTPQSGQAIWIVAEDGTKVPVPVGEIPLDDGTVLVVMEEGIISEIRPEGAEQEQELEEDSTANGDANNIVQQVQEGIKSIMIKYEKENKSKWDKNKEDIKALQKENESLKEEIVEFSKKPAAKTISKVVVQKEPTSKRARLTQFLNNRN